MSADSPGTPASFSLDNRPDTPDRDDRLVELLDQYLSDLEQGCADRQAFLDAHPEYADDLEACLASLEFMRVADVARLPVSIASAGDGCSRVDAEIGDYRIVRLIGRGGMGIVYEAEQLSLDRRVALKVLPMAGMLDARQLARFKHEAHAAAQLHHSNIVPVFAVGCERGVHYYAMQYIEGRTLADVIVELKRSGGEQPASSTISGLTTGGSTSSTAYFRGIARLAVQVADALEHAHSMGVVHRDIKPSNLLLADDGRVWVTDFGLAQLDADAGLTMTGDVVGTLRYMSPEQASGRRAEVDGRTDVYSLGITLYELLTLKQAFPGDDRRLLLKRICSEEPPQPRSLNRALPHELETIVLKSITKDRHGRYATAQEMADDLRRFLNDEPILARRPTIWQRIAKWAKRHRGVVATALVSLALLLLLVSVGASLAAVWFGRERDVAMRAGWEARRQRAVAQQAARSAQLLLFENYLAQSQADREGLGPGRASFDAVTKAAKLAIDLDLEDDARLRLRNEAIACLAVAADLTPTQPPWPSETRTWYVDFDPTLTYYVRSGGSPHAVSIRRVSDDKVVATLPARPEEVLGPFLFSPNGSRLLVRYAIGSRVTERLWDWHAAEVLAEVPMAPNCFACDFRPDAKAAAIVGADMKIHILDTQSGNEISATTLAHLPEEIRYEPNNNVLAVAVGARIELWDAPDGRIRRVYAQPSRVKHIDWSPNGDFIAAVCDDLNVYLTETATGSQAAVLSSLKVDGTVSFSPKGDLLATQATGGQTVLWDWRSARPIVAARGRFVRFSSDSQQLGYAMAASVGVWGIDAGDRYYRNWYDSHHDGPFGVAFGVDGRLLVFGAGDGVRLCDAESGRQLADLRIGRTLSVFVKPIASRPAQYDLITSGTEGLFRWRISTETSEWHIGPPERLGGAVVARNPVASIDRDGRRIARVVGPSQVRILDLETGKTVWLRGHADVTHVTLSPDGHLAVTGAWHGGGVLLWDADTGQRLDDLWPGPGPARAEFSPDGRWLAVSRGLEDRLYDADTWRVVWSSPRSGATEEPGSIAFAPDSSVVALRASSDGLRLLESSTGRELATLMAPGQAHSGRAAFSEDGTRLAESRSHMVGLWYLDESRKRLRELELDWDQPGASHGAKLSRESPTCRVDYGALLSLADRYDPVYLFANRLVFEGKYRSALESYDELLRRRPDHAPACNNVAWLLVSGPRELRDAARAKVLAERAVRLRPSEAAYVNTLGVAYYRLGSLDLAVETLERAAALTNGGTACDYFFLAMCHFKLGEQEKARSEYDRAIQWWEARPWLASEWVEELTAFRAEADQVLGQQ